MYYVLECIPREGYLRVLERAPDIEGVKRNAFRLGRKIDVNVPEPIEFSLDPTVHGDMPTFFRNPYKIMKLDFLETLQKAGVDNIDTYAAVIRDTENDRIWENYAIANIVGVVDAADMDKSEYAGDSNMISVLFDSLAIDETKTGGLKLFRLAQKISTIVVSEDVKYFVEEHYAADDVKFIEPKNFA